MSALAYSYSVAMTELQCCQCGTCFGMPTVLYDNVRKTKQHFYCPNGHSQWFGESEADRLKKQLEAERQRVIQANAARWKAEEEKTKAERKLKRTEKRIKNGICPCCQRTFSHSRLVAHIKAKHPDFAAPETKTA